MRPTTDKERVRTEDKNGLSFVVDPGIQNLLFSEQDLEVWLEILDSVIKGLCQNPDLTTNNHPPTISDEAVLMSDRLFLAYKFRQGLNKETGTKSDRKK